MQNKDDEKIPDVSRDNWNAKELSEQSVNEQPDETLRKVLRGDESKGDADVRDMIGKVSDNETPQGREESKNETGAKENG